MAIVVVVAEPTTVLIIAGIACWLVGKIPFAPLLASVPYTEAGDDGSNASEDDEDDDNYYCGRDSSDSAFSLVVAFLEICTAGRHG